jgi:hypothetical protein
LRQAAEAKRRRQQDEAARQANEWRGEQLRTNPSGAESQLIVGKVLEQVPGATANQVLNEVAKVLAKGTVPRNWVAYMIWWMRDRPDRDKSNSGAAQRAPAGK